MSFQQTQALGSTMNRHPGLLSMLVVGDQSWNFLFGSNNSARRLHRPCRPDGTRRGRLPIKRGPKSQAPDRKRWQLPQQLCLLSLLQFFRTHVQ